ncbi:hypothetical protein ABW20_dc0104252 [Dactylellina cionopaga]|nr:hypothetical protein ABW20_dc0104252 [Dactylellina cionopaga]
MGNFWKREKSSVPKEPPILPPLDEINSSLAEITAAVDEVLAKDALDREQCERLQARGIEIVSDNAFIFNHRLYRSRDKTRWECVDADSFDEPQLMASTPAGLPRPGIVNPVAPGILREQPSYGSASVDEKGRFGKVKALFQSASNKEFKRSLQKRNIKILHETAEGMPGGYLTQNAELASMELGYVAGAALGKDTHKPDALHASTPTENHPKFVPHFAAVRKSKPVLPTLQLPTTPETTAIHPSEMFPPQNLCEMRMDLMRGKFTLYPRQGIDQVFIDLYFTGGDSLDISREVATTLYPDLYQAQVQRAWRSSWQGANDSEKHSGLDDFAPVNFGGREEARIASSKAHGITRRDGGLESEPMQPVCSFNDKEYTPEISVSGHDTYRDSPKEAGPGIDEMDTSAIDQRIACATGYPVESKPDWSSQGLSPTSTDARSADSNGSTCMSQDRGKVTNMSPPREEEIFDMDVPLRSLGQSRRRYPSYPQIATARGLYSSIQPPRGIVSDQKKPQPIRGIPSQGILAGIFDDSTFVEELEGCRPPTRIPWQQGTMASLPLKPKTKLTNGLLLAPLLSNNLRVDDVLQHSGGERYPGHTPCINDRIRTRSRNQGNVSAATAQTRYKDCVEEPFWSDDEADDMYNAAAPLRSMKYAIPAPNLTPSSSHRFIPAAQESDTYKGVAKSISCEAFNVRGSRTVGKENFDTVQAGFQREHSTIDPIRGQTGYTRAGYQGNSTGGFGNQQSSLAVPSLRHAASADSVFPTPLRSFPRKYPHQPSDPACLSEFGRVKLMRKEHKLHRDLEVERKATETPPQPMPEVARAA